MTKLLISCDDRIYVYNGEYYFKNQEWCDFYNRYLRIFDSIKIVVRCSHVYLLEPCRIRVDNPRIEVVDVPDFSGPKEYAKVFFKVGFALRNVCMGCDAAIIRLPSTIAQRVAGCVMKVRLPFGVEVVYDAEDGWKSQTNLLNRILWKRIDKEMRKTCYKADGVSCVTEHYLQKHYFSRKANAFTSHYSSLALPKAFYASNRKYPLGKDFVVANVANQVQYKGRKGFNEIIEALSILKKRGTIVKAKFAGKDYQNGIGQLRALAEKLGVHEQIEFLGYINRAELDAFLSSVDAFVMPTRSEGLPRVIIEAMAKGLPAISTPVSGNPELLSRHFLVGYEDVETLADRIEELIKDKCLYEKTSEENFQNSLKYEASILERRRDDFYRKLRECVRE